MTGLQSMDLLFKFPERIIRKFWEDSKGKTKKLPPVWRQLPLAGDSRQNQFKALLGRDLIG
jgi:hypothetical protein